MAELIPTISLILITSSVMLLLLDRLSYPTIPAYIISGVILNQYIIHEQLLSFAELGIIFLVFIFGIRMEPEKLGTVARESASTALIITSLMAFGTYIVAIELGLNTVNAIYFSIAASISSSLVGIELLEKDIRADLLHGRLAQSIHLIQDFLAILFILVSGSLTAQNFTSSLLTGIMLILLALFIRAHLIDRVMELAGDSRELTMLAALSVLTGFIAITEIVNLSTVIGSFAAGLAMAKFPHNTESLESISSLKDFFSALFFVSLGSLLKVPSLGAVILSILLILGTLVIKPLLTAFYLIHIGYDHRTAYLTGFSLDQVSEFALMISIQAFAAATIAEPLFQAIVITATVTMVISTYTTRYGEEIYKHISQRLDVDETRTKIKEGTHVEDVENHTIIVGYGTQGQKLVETLKGIDEDTVVIENDPEKVSEAKKNVKNYVFGDAVDDETWNLANVDRARLIISTVPSHRLSKEILRLDSNADKILRTEEVEDAKELMDQGAFFVEVPDIMASEQLVEHIRHVTKDVNTKEELRRQNLLEIRKNLNDNNL